MWRCYPLPWGVQGCYPLPCGVQRLYPLPCGVQRCYLCPVVCRGVTLCPVVCRGVTLCPARCGVATICPARCLLLQRKRAKRYCYFVLCSQPLGLHRGCEIYAETVQDTGGALQRRQAVLAHFGQAPVPEMLFQTRRQSHRRLQGQYQNHWLHS